MMRVVVFTAAGFAMSAGAFGDLAPISTPAPRMSYDVDRMWAFRDIGRSAEWPGSWGAGVEHGRVSRLVLAVHRGFPVAHGDGMFDEVLDGGLSPTFVVIREGPGVGTNLTLVPAPLSVMMGLAGLGGVGVLGVARRRSVRVGRLGH